MVLRATTRLIRLIAEIVVIIVVAFILSFVVRTLLVETYEVPSGSMEDTIQIGDRILSEKISYYFGEPQKGDIITFESPIQSEDSSSSYSVTTTDQDTANQEIFVKRVIATEGDTIDIRNGSVYVNGELLAEDYVKDGDPTVTFTSTYQDMEIEYPYTVPEDELWVMGDNRTNSRDSRYFGPIEVSSITGRVFFRYWPLHRFGLM